MSLYPALLQLLRVTLTLYSGVYNKATIKLDEHMCQSSMLTNNVCSGERAQLGL